MEQRVQKLETSINELNTEVKLMNQTLSSIAQTLSEFKEILKSVNKIEVDVVGIKRDIESNNEKIGILFKKQKDMEKRLDDIEKTDVGTGITVGAFEKGIWLVFGGIVTFAIAYFGGNR